MGIDRRVAFLGAGAMGSALIRGALDAGVCSPGLILATDVDAARLAELANRFGITTSADNAEAAQWGDVLVLAVKPQVVAAVLDQIGPHVRDDQLLISIAAGVPTAAIASRLGRAARVVRAMPNTPAQLGAGAAGIAAGSAATEEDLRLARQLFDAVGVSVVVDERLLDVVTGLSGSGPAYLFAMVEALEEAGSRAGLPPEAAGTLAVQTVIGAARLLAESGLGARALREAVTSPGGTTVAGLGALAEAGFGDLIARVVAVATARSTELGEEVTRSLGSG